MQRWQNSLFIEQNYMNLHHFQVYGIKNCNEIYIAGLEISVATRCPSHLETVM